MGKREEGIKVIKAKRGKRRSSVRYVHGDNEFRHFSRSLSQVLLGVGIEISGSWIPGLALLARNDGLLVFVIPAISLF